MAFDYKGARESGYSDEEISSYLAKNNPNFDVKAAQEAGYSPEEISQYIAKPKQDNKNEKPVEETKKSNGTSFADNINKATNKATRLVTQGAIGAIQRATLGYDLAAIVSRKAGIANAPNELRQSIVSDIETLMDKKAIGKWTEEDQKEYDYLLDLAQNPKKVEQFIPKEEDVPNYDVASLIEAGAKKFGVDLTPQGADELALRWIGLIKDPKKAQELIRNGFNPKNVKEVFKALAPTGKEALRGLGAGTAIQYAAEAELGPIGTMTAAILGDIAPTVTLKTLGAGAKFAKTPLKNTIKSAKESGKKAIAKTIVKFTPKDKIALQKELVNNFREAGIQADPATISGNRLVNLIQSTLDQSGLTGSAFDEFKKSLSKSVVSEYQNLASELGESVYQSKYEAGEALKNGLTEAREIDYGVARDLYKSARERSKGAQVYAGNVGSVIEELEKSLEPGSFKSADQKAVLDILNKVKNDVMVDGNPKGASIESLINDKIALNDAIDYEVQGGTKQLLKRVVGEVDKAIASHGEVDPTFAKEWKMANKKFSEHAKTFRGKTISQALNTQDPSLIFSKMNTPHGISEIKKALTATPEGRELFNQLSRHKLEEMVGNNMINSTTKQMNFGGFSKLLEKGQNRQIAKSLLGESSFKKLEKLQSASGKLAETAQKFLNSSRSGVHAADLAFAGKIVMDAANVFAGNPWPLLKSGGGLVAARSTAKLFTDPEFLQLLEDAVLESGTSSSKALENTAIRISNRVKTLEEPAKAAIQSQPSKKNSAN